MISMIIICALLFAGLLQYRSHRRLLALKSQLETTLVEKITLNYDFEKVNAFIAHWLILPMKDWRYSESTFCIR